MSLKRSAYETWRADNVISTPSTPPLPVSTTTLTPTNLPGISRDDRRQPALYALFAHETRS